VIINDIKPALAIKACELQGSLKSSTLYYHVQMAIEKGTYDSDKKKRYAKKKKIEIEIDIEEDDEDESQESPSTRNISPITMNTLSSGTTVATATTSLSTKRSRKSSRQAGLARLDFKRRKVDYDGRYKTAFKKATSLVESGTNGSAVSICDRLNVEYNLDERRLARSTVYNAVNEGRSGLSPKVMGPKPKIPDELVAMVAIHAEVSQVGDGELRGRDIKRLIDASIVDTEYETQFTLESVWRKVRKEFPESMHAATRMSVEDARAQWTTHDNLDQWFTDVKCDLLTTGLVIDEEVFNIDGGLESEVRFKSDTERRIINMDETHHDLSITGDKGGSRAVSYHNPKFQRGASRGVKSSRHVTGVYATNSAGEALPPFLSLTRVPSLM
jgi:hypothetical protein